MSANDSFSDADLFALIRAIPDFPKPGILFRDITPALLHPAAFHHCIVRLAEAVRPLQPEVIVAVEARGFLFGAALAYHLGIGLGPVRKPGKLPWRSIREPYSLEYGSDALEMHEDALVPGTRAVVVDDVLATGGTAAAVGRLVARGGGTLCGYAFLLEIMEIGGRKMLPDSEVRCVLSL